MSDRSGRMTPVADIALFHSIYGLRPAVVDAAERLRAAGHHVVAPDLFGGAVAETSDEGFAIRNKVGMETIMRRAHESVAGLREDAVLGGLSFGAGVAGELLVGRRAAAGMLILHSIAGEPEAVRPGLPMEVHIADPDEFDGPDDVKAWQQSMVDAGAVVEVFWYPGVGHIFTDPGLPDYGADEAESTWRRSLEFIDRVSRSA
jgi:dienelactone hydrolase